VRRLVHERRIPVVRLGRHVRLAQVDLDHYVAAGRTEPLDPSPSSRPARHGLRPA
jgi:hypothetical protein